MPNQDMSNNKQTTLFSLEFAITAATIIFASGIAYNAIAGTQEDVKEIRSQQQVLSEVVHEIEATQRGVLASQKAQHETIRDLKDGQEDILKYLREHFPTKESRH